MKKKIMVFMLLFAFLVGVVAPDQAKAANSTETTADDVKYRDIEDFMHGAGYLDFEMNEDSFYFCVKQSDYIYIYELSGYLDCEPFVALKANSDYVYFFCEAAINAYKRYEYQYYNFEKAALHANYDCLNYVEKTFTNSKMNTDQYYYNDLYNYYLYFGPCVADSILYCDLDIYNVKPESGYFYESYDELWFEKTVSDGYTFPSWCSDSGLICGVSSNESSTVIPFFYEPDDYHYIVRRNRISGSQYIWYLSQVTKEDELIYYSTNRALANSSIGAAALYVLSGEYAAGSTNVRNYVYDSSGGGWLYTDNYSIDLGLTNEYYVDDIGITYSSSMPIVYSSTDIYSDKEQSSVFYAANTEYEDSEVTYPDISPTSTPTPTPISNSGSTDLGGNVVAGGGIDFIISLVSSLWNRVYSIPMYVDGFQISLQQLYVYGILAGIVGAAIFAFTRRK